MESNGDADAFPDMMIQSLSTRKLYLSKTTFSVIVSKISSSGDSTVFRKVFIYTETEKDTKCCSNYARPVVSAVTQHLEYTKNRKTEKSG